MKMSNLKWVSELRENWKGKHYAECVWQIVKTIILVMILIWISYEVAKSMVIGLKPYVSLLISLALVLFFIGVPLYCACRSWQRRKWFTDFVLIFHSVASVILGAVLFTIWATKYSFEDSTSILGPIEHHREVAQIAKSAPFIAIAIVADAVELLVLLLFYTDVCHSSQNERGIWKILNLGKTSEKFVENWFVRTFYYAPIILVLAFSVAALVSVEGNDHEVSKMVLNVIAGWITFSYFTQLMDERICPQRGLFKQQRNKD